MNKAEQVHFFKRLSFLIGAQVPILESLHILQEQAAHSRQKKLLQKIAKDVSEGQSLSRSFGRHPKLFSSFSLSMLSVAEESGTLHSNLIYLSEELQKRQALKRKLLAAALYPAVIAVATLAITTFLLLYLFPKITPLFKSLHASLPLSTRIVMGLSTFIVQWGLLAAIAVAFVAVLAIICIRRSERLHRCFDQAMLRVPLLGTMLRSYNLSNASRTLGLLVKGGMPFSESLLLIARASTNRAYKEVYEELSLVVAGGERASRYVRRKNVCFPPLYGHMLAVGEKSGTLSDTCLYLADLHATEIDEFAKTLSSLLEPALMILIGVLVGFIALSIISPLYDITQSLHA